MAMGMKLFVFLWLMMATRAAGAIMAARQCLRIRRRTKNMIVYEWFTAMGIGFGFYGVSDIFIIWNGIVNGPIVAGLYSPAFLWIALASQLLQTVGVWLITLVLMNGESPGWIRTALYWTLRSLRLFHPPGAGPKIP